MQFGSSSSYDPRDAANSFSSNALPNRTAPKYSSSPAPAPSRLKNGAYRRVNAQLRRLPSQAIIRRLSSNDAANERHVCAAGSPDTGLTSNRVVQSVGLSSNAFTVLSKTDTAKPAPCRRPSSSSISMRHLGTARMLQAQLTE